jgi:AcrR family transcriptional regulator
MRKAPVGRPRGADRENSSRRRKQLVDAAVASIVENGLSATTLATVAKASGLSQGTAVFYFKTKDTLLSEAFQQRMEEYKQAYRNAMDAAGDDPVERVIALALNSLHPDVMTRDNLALWNEFWPDASRSPRLNEVFRRVEAERQALIRQMFEEASEALENSDWTPSLAAQTMETMVEGIWTRLHYSPNYLAFEEAIAMMAHLLCIIFPTYADRIRKTASDLKTDSSGSSD